MVPYGHLLSSLNAYRFMVRAPRLTAKHIKIEGPVASLGVAISIGSFPPIKRRSGAFSGFPVADQPVTTPLRTLAFRQVGPAF